MAFGAFFIRRPIGTLLFTLGVLLFGWVAYGHLPLASLPTIDLPTLRVHAGLPGASPETMASAVAAPLERHLGAIAGLTEMTSVSTLGSTQIILQFGPNHSATAAGRDVQAAIDRAAADLPADLPAPPRFFKTNPAATPLLSVALTSDALPPERLYDLADRVIAQRLAQIPGVGEVTINGAEKPAVRVRVDPARLSALRLTWERVRAAVAAAAGSGPAGRIEGPARAYSVAIANPPVAAEDFQRLVVAWRDGAPVRLEDVATVTDDVANTRAAAWLDGRRAVLLTIQRQPGANLVETVDQVRAALPTLREWLPPSVEIIMLADRSGTIRASISHMKLTLGVTIVLVVAVNALFLRRLRMMLIPGLAIPVSLAATFAAMWGLGYGLDNLTLMALTVAVGFVVDDAIVMTENIARHIDRGLSPWRATLTGSRQVVFTILSMTLSLVAAFIPIIFMDGIIGRFFQVFGITLSVAILVSAVVSLTLTPVLCAHWAGRGHRAPEGVADSWLVRGYARSLDVVLRHRRLALTATFGLCAATVALYGVVPKGFIPPQDTGLITAWTEAAQDVSFASMSERQQAVAGRVRADPAVLSVGALVGGGWAGTNAGGLTVVLKPHRDPGDTAEVVAARLRRDLAGLPGIATYLAPASDIGVGGRVGRAPYQLTLRGENIDALNQGALMVLDRLRRLPELVDVNSDQQIGGLQARLTVDRDGAGRLGFSAAEIDQTLYDAFGQRQIATLYGTSGQTTVVLERDPEAGDAVPAGGGALERMWGGATDGSPVPFAAFSRLEVSATAQLVAHDGHHPAVTLSFNTAPGTPLSRAMDAITAATAELRLPPSLTLSFEGSAKAYRKAKDTQPVLILTAILVIYIVLGILYESVIHPLTILSTLPAAALGALLAMLASGTELNVIAMIGIILLLGVVKKNAIILVDFAIQSEAGRGLSPEAAIRDACLQRFRPIAMTTLAALLGAIPLAWGGGVAAELRQPFGIAIVGGLAFSQILTLYTVPVIHVWLDALRRRR